MEYNFYLEQKYLYEGRVETRILTAAQAEALSFTEDKEDSTQKQAKETDFSGKKAKRAERRSIRYSARLL